MNYLIAILLSSIGDRIRGGDDIYWYSTSIAGAFLFTVAIHIIHPLTPLLFVAVFAGYLAGEAKGWGEPLSAYVRNVPMIKDSLESWQFGKLKKDSALALLFRGAMWGLPVAISLYYAINMDVAVAAFIAFTVSMKLSIDIVKRIPNTDNATILWQKSEQVRGVLVMTVICFACYNWA